MTTNNKNQEEIIEFNREQGILKEFENKFGEPKDLLEVSRAIHLTFKMQKEEIKKAIGEIEKFIDKHSYPSYDTILKKEFSEIDTDKIKEELREKLI